MTAEVVKGKKTAHFLPFDSYQHLFIHHDCLSGAVRLRGKVSGDGKRTLLEGARDVGL